MTYSETPLMHSVCGIDFATSNATIGVIDDGQPRLLPLEGDELTLPRSSVSLLAK